MARLMITLEETERDALRLLAKEERRDPREQAALLIRHELERRGLEKPTQMTVSKQLFEYKIFLASFDVTDNDGEEKKKSEEALNALAKEGWEVISYNGETIFLLRRRVE